MVGMSSMYHLGHIPIELHIVIAAVLVKLFLSYTSVEMIEKVNKKVDANITDLTQKIIMRIEIENFLGK